MDAEILPQDSSNWSTATLPVELSHGVPTASVTRADPSQGAEAESRGVEYKVAVPGDPARWLTIV